jgi:flagellar protein FliS
MAELNPYKKTAVTTATGMELVLMIYDECIRSLDQAMEAFKIEGPEAIEQIGSHLLHAQETITELDLSLDLERGEEIAVNLHRLYEFMVHHLSQANVKKELGPVKEVREMMDDLREVWKQVAAQESMFQKSEAPLGTRSGRFSLSG